MSQVFDSRVPLLQIASNDYWTIDEAFEGTHIFGATGSGKTSGSGKAIAKAFLRAGFGGLVLTVKPDETDNWRQYCAETGRSDSLIVMSEDAAYRFNFLEYEATRPDGGGRTENIMALLDRVLEIMERGNAKADDEFWRRTSRQLLRNVIDLLKFGKQRINFLNIHRIMRDAPQTRAQLGESTWQKDNLLYQCLQKVLGIASLPGTMSHDAQMVLDYWCTDYPDIPDRTRESIRLIINSMKDAFLRGDLYRLFSTTTNISPEMTRDGAIIVLDLPQKKYGDLGIWAQSIFKMMWQECIERQKGQADLRPVFLWADESQYFANRYDAIFQTTARSARACTVYLTQNLPNYYAAMGGSEKGKDLTHAMLANFQTKIWHQNTCHITNTWAADTIAKQWESRDSEGFSRNLGDEGEQGNRDSFSTSEQTSFEYEVPPRTFSRLRKGGMRYQCVVDGLFYAGGRPIGSGDKGHAKLEFSQKEI